MLAACRNAILWAVVRKNGIRRKIVLMLLGEELAIVRRTTPRGDEWQLVDEKRRIPYGWVRACAVETAGRPAGKWRKIVFSKDR